MNGRDPDDPLAGATAAYLDYAEAVDGAEPDDFAALFTEDGVFFDDAVVGRDAIAERCRSLLRLMRASSHHMTNIRVGEVSGSEVEARAYIYVWHEMASGDQVEAWGRYRSRLRYEDGRWRFCDHRFLVAGVRPEGALGRVEQAPRADG